VEGGGGGGVCLVGRLEVDEEGKEVSEEGEEVSEEVSD
jgi:hypothetical protein